jgi:hypothetical protein
MIKEQGVAKSCVPHHVVTGGQKIKELQRINHL